MRPSLFIITGSNGAGKSTVGASYLPSEVQSNYTVFDGDKLSSDKRRELYPAFTRSIKEAKRLADEWLDEFFRQQVKLALEKKDHFAYEGHFRSSNPLKVPRKFKNHGYYLSLIFMGLTDPYQSQLRVIDRAKYGGHNVPPYDIEANFYGNLRMLNKNYKLFNEVVIIDTSKSLEHNILLHLRNSEVIFYARQKDQPDWFCKFLPNLISLIIAEENN